MSHEGYGTTTCAEKKRYAERGKEKSIVSYWYRKKDTVYSDRWPPSDPNAPEPEVSLAYTGTSDDDRDARSFLVKNERRVKLISRQLELAQAREVLMASLQ